MSDDFDWSPTNEDVILPEQRPTAVYTNGWGQAVIRQERAYNDDADSFIIIDHGNIPGIIAALRKIADGPCDRDAAEPPPAEESKLPHEVRRDQAAARAAAKEAGKATGAVVDLNDHVAAQSRKAFGDGGDA